MTTDLFSGRAVRRSVAGALAALLLCIPTAAAAAVNTTHHVATFGPRGAVFVESVAVNSHGTAFITRTHWGTTNNHGGVIRISRTEQKSSYGPRVSLGPYGMLAGIATNAKNEVYLARYMFGGSLPSTIYRVRPKHLDQVATLPAGSFPNALTFHRGRLYVSDPAAGVIWRFLPRPGTVRHLTHPWAAGAALAAPSADELGINGIAFWGDVLYGVNYGKGLLVRIPLKQDGTAGKTVRIVRTAKLVTADGIAFDRAGHLWVVGNGMGTQGTYPPDGQFLMLMTRSGKTWDRTVDAAWMNYPTALALGRSPATAHRMFVTNGAFYGGNASLVSFRLKG